MKKQNGRNFVLSLTLGLWLTGGTFAIAQVDTSGFDYEDFRNYGNCFVRTGTDMITDEKQHIFGCMEPTANDSPIIGIVSWPDKTLLMRFYAGEISHSEETIPMVIRIDKDPIIRRTAYWYQKEHWALISDQGLAAFLLDELATGVRVAIQVGDQQGHIKLHGSAAAIADFRKRVGR